MRTTTHEYRGVRYAVLDQGFLVYGAVSEALCTEGGGVRCIKAHGASRAGLHRQVKADIDALPDGLRNPRWQRVPTPVETAA